MLENNECMDCRKPLTDNEINLVQKKINRILPSFYIDFIKKCNGGRLLNPCFEYYDEDLHDVWITGVGIFLSLSPEQYDDFISVYNSPPEFFPDGLVAFAETGGGDLICFDYREGKDNPDPAIVYWNHEADIGKDVSFIAENFEAFLGMLKKPED